MSNSGQRDLTWPLQPGDVPNITSLVEDVAADIDSSVAEFGGTLVLCEMPETGQGDFCRFAERLTQFWENGGITSLVIDAHPAAPFMGDLFPGDSEGFNEVLHYGLSPEKVAVARDGISGMWMPAGAPWTGSPESPEEPERSLRRFAESADRVLLLASAADEEGLLEKLREVSQFRLVMGQFADQATAPTETIPAPEVSSSEDQVLDIDGEPESQQRVDEEISMPAMGSEFDVESYDSLADAVPQVESDDDVSGEQAGDDIIDPPEEEISTTPVSGSEFREPEMVAETVAEPPVPEQEQNSAPDEGDEAAALAQDLQVAAMAADLLEEGEPTPEFSDESNGDDPQEFRVGGGVRKQVMIPALVMLLIVITASSYLYVQRFGWRLPGNGRTQLTQDQIDSGRTTRLPDRAELPYRGTDPEAITSEGETEFAADELDRAEAELREFAVQEPDEGAPAEEPENTVPDTTPIQEIADRRVPSTTVNAGLGLPVPEESNIQPAAERGVTTSRAIADGIWINREAEPTGKSTSPQSPSTFTNNIGRERRITAASGGQTAKRRLESRDRWRSALDHDGAFLVHVESYQDSALGAWSARQRGFSPVGYKLLPTIARDTTWYRLCVGPFPTLGTAAAFRDSMLDRTAADYCVIAVDREK